MNVWELPDLIVHYADVGNGVIRLLFQRLDVLIEQNDRIIALLEAMA